MTINDFHVGQQSSLTVKVTAELIQAYSNSISDRNPIHIDDEYAKKTIFGQRIAHGMLLGGFISAVLGNQLPGPGTIYLSQSMKFLKPVYIDETVETRCTITNIKIDKKIIVLSTICLRDDEVVAEGEAVIKYIDNV